MADFTIWQLFTEAYTRVLGDWFLVFLMFISLATIYIRTKNIGMVLMLTIICGGVLGSVIPGGPVRTFLFFVVVFGLVATFFRLFVKKATPWGE